MKSVNENIEMKKILHDYHSLNDKLGVLEEEHKKEMVKLGELEKEYDFADDFLNIEAAKIKTKKNQINNSKKKYVNKKFFKHNVKSILIGLSIPLFGLFIPGVLEFCLSDVFFYSIITAFSGVILLGLDSLAFFDINERRFSEKFYESDIYQKFREELKELEDMWEEKLCEYQDVTNNLRAQNKKTDELMKEISNTKNKILIMKEKLFNRIFDLPNEEMIIDETIVEEKPNQLVLR